jgi:hypothetical protein
VLDAAAVEPVHLLVLLLVLLLVILEVQQRRRRCQALRARHQRPQVVRLQTPLPARLRPQHRLRRPLALHSHLLPRRDNPPLARPFLRRRAEDKVVVEGAVAALAYPTPGRHS